jgi:hypothetical protein
MLLIPEFEVARLDTIHALFVIATLVLATQGITGKVYPGVDGNHVVVHSTKKVEATPESRLEFYGRNKQLFCALDYSSRDGEHGYGVEKAGWTPDGSYFVAALASSGGHQAWHSRTIIYSQDKKWFVNLDDFVDGLGISSSSFELIAPHTLSTHVLKDREILVTFNLDDLFQQATLAKSTKGIGCAEAKTLKSPLLR